MSESLLRISEVLLFGRELNDLKIHTETEDDIGVPDHVVKCYTKKKIDITATFTEINRIPIAANDKVLVKNQGKGKELHKDNDVYEVQADKTLSPSGSTNHQTVAAESGEQWLVLSTGAGANTKRRFVKLGKNKDAVEKRKFGNKMLESQWAGEDPKLARIYGFGFEGTYYELPNPTVFLVHGKGESVTDGNLPSGPSLKEEHASRAPTNPSLSGVAAADFQFSDDVMMWSYDKADYSIRMDIETGMLEQILLDAYFGGDDGAFVSGSKVSGSKVSGSKVSGSKVAGSKVRGSKLRGD
jgi:hypothetical protein